MVMALPFAVHSAGWGLSLAVLVVCAFFGWLTAGWTIEACARAGAILRAPPAATRARSSAAVGCRAPPEPAGGAAPSPPAPAQPPANERLQQWQDKWAARQSAPVLGGSVPTSSLPFINVAMPFAVRPTTSVITGVAKLRVGVFP